MRHGRRSAGHKRPGLVALGWFAILALLSNVSVVQAHVHPHHRVTGLVTAAETPVAAAPAERCALCAAAAAFEPLVPADAGALALPAAFMAPVGPSVLASRPRASPAHYWHSRAPPERLSI